MAALLGAGATTASAEVSGPATTVDEAVRQAGISDGVVADLPPEVAESATPSVCFSGHVQDVGWQPWMCDDDSNWAFAGTTGNGLRLEALRVAPSATGGVTCVQAHVQNQGWNPPKCVNDGRTAEIGTVGLGLRMEAMTFSSSTRTTCAEAHMQNYGWLGNVCEPAGKVTVVGIASLGLRMEAVEGKID
ncbi:hypothetical protein ACFWN2_28425 [Lentzea sp. NPDC058436]|uniref:hypothetical protein n=1 Tax=Lentzea sp. NPDC058436 TaxID=3346499 RepID=UPI00365AFF97